MPTINDLLSGVQPFINVFIPAIVILFGVRIALGIARELIFLSRVDRR